MSRTRKRLRYTLPRKEGKVDVVNSLFDHGADVNAKNASHKTSAVLDRGAEAACRRHAGADRTRRKHERKEAGPLDPDASFSTQRLLDHGADANLVNDDGRSPYQLAVGKGPRVITDVLREPDYQRKCTLIIPIG